mmetsp:Transcript_11686/g.43553  ORF Transcript_11686/g.43553 Transcript_11686/m.43553 type:complete len:271 (-) Transcript_11686:2-814(-)
MDVHSVLQHRRSGPADEKACEPVVDVVRRDAEHRQKAPARKEGHVDQRGAAQEEGKRQRRAQHDDRRAPLHLGIFPLAAWHHDVHAIHGSRLRQPAVVAQRLPIPHVCIQQVLGVQNHRHVAHDEPRHLPHEGLGGEALAQQRQYDVEHEQLHGQLHVHELRVDDAGGEVQQADASFGVRLLLAFPGQAPPAPGHQEVAHLQGQGHAHPQDDAVEHGGREHAPAGLEDGARLLEADLHQVAVDSPREGPRFLGGAPPPPPPPRGGTKKLM